MNKLIKWFIDFSSKIDLAQLQSYMDVMQYCDSCGARLKASATSHSAKWNPHTGQLEAYGIRLACPRHPGGPSLHFHRLWSIKITPASLQWLKDMNIENAKKVFQELNG